MNRAGPALEATAGMRNLDDCTPKAYELLASPASRDAFDLAKEPQTIRDFYGADSLRPETACWPGGWWRRACRWSPSTRSATAIGIRTATTSRC